MLLLFPCFFVFFCSLLKKLIGIAPCSFPLTHTMFPPRAGPGTRSQHSDLIHTVTFHFCTQPWPWISLRFFLAWWSNFLGRGEGLFWSYLTYTGLYCGASLGGTRQWVVFNRSVLVVVRVWKYLCTSSQSRSEGSRSSPSVWGLCWLVVGEAVWDGFNLKTGNWAQSWAGGWDVRDKTCPWHWDLLGGIRQSIAGAGGIRKQIRARWRVNGRGDLGVLAGFGLPAGPASSAARSSFSQTKPESLFIIWAKRDYLAVTYELLS